MGVDIRPSEEEVEEEGLSWTMPTNINKEPKLKKKVVSLFDSPKEDKPIIDPTDKPKSNKGYSDTMKEYLRKRGKL
jgi:hypothetical protein